MRKKICIFAVTILTLLFILKISSAIPSFYSSQNNTYVFGRDSDVFSIIVNEANLNTSSVVHHMRVYEPGSKLYNTTASCFSYSATEWLCNNTASTFGSFPSDGKTFIYYYDAYDSFQNYNSSGIYLVVIDRSSPDIKFVEPLNESYAGEMVNITMAVTDSYSGVNQSTVFYSTDNSVWAQANLVGSYYNGSWNASSFANNQSVTIYANATDKLGNTNSTYINVLIDNEAPKIFITSPTLNQVLNGTMTLRLEVTDQYSGGDNSSVYYLVDSATKSFSCSGTQNLVCSVSMQTTDIADGTKTIYFYAKDRAKNIASNSTAVTFDNLPPSISILQPQKNSIVYGTIKISASVADLGVGVDKVTYRWESSSNNGSWTGMDCSGSINSYLCNASWDTTAVSDGNYVIKIDATDKLGRSSEASVNFVVNNFEHATTTASQTATTTQTPTGETNTAQTTTTAVSKTTPFNLIQTISEAISSSAKKISEAVSPLFQKMPDPVKKWMPLITLSVAIIATVILFFLFLRELRTKRSIQFS